MNNTKKNIYIGYVILRERGIIEIMTKKWFLLKVLYIFIVFWGSVTCNEKTVANEYTIVDENAGYNFLGFCYTGIWRGIIWISFVIVWLVR